MNKFSILRAAKKIICLIAVAVLMVSMAACTGDGGLESESESESEISTESDDVNTEAAESGDTEAKKEYPTDAALFRQLSGPKAGDDIAIIETSMGTIKVFFFPEVAPKAVENFLTHSKNGYYNGLIFHRVDKDFVIQGGDPEGTGLGGESIFGEGFGIEVGEDFHHIRGAMAMAQSQEPDSIGSQFYFVTNTDLDLYDTANLKKQLEGFKEEPDKIFNSDPDDPKTVMDLYPHPFLNEYIENGGAPFLDYGYTVFGQIYEGLEVIDAIQNVEVNASEKPIEDVVIKSITVEKFK